VCALAFLFTALVITYFSLTQAAERADTAKLQNEQKAAGYTETQAAATRLRNDLSSAKTLFDNEILYSKLVTRLSGILPSGTAIDSLQVDSSSFTQPVTLNVQIRDRAAAEALQRNFTSSPYVTGVTLGSISTNTGGSSYPYSVELQFTFNRSIGQ
jgi:Tfp pilus assembly protein PilN